MSGEFYYATSYVDKAKILVKNNPLPIGMIIFGVFLIILDLLVINKEGVASSVSRSGGSSKHGWALFGGFLAGVGLAIIVAMPGGV